MGPGLLESTYQQCLAHEMKLLGLPFQVEASMAVHYKGVNLDCGYKLDFLVDDFVVIELKAVQKNQ